MASQWEVAIVQLEEAASVILASDGVSAERRTEAETVFHQMRKLPKPYSLCQSILESKCSAYVKFQAVVTMKEALMREWLVIPVQEKFVLRQYLFHYLSKQSSLPQYIRQHVFYLMAILIKRGTLEAEGQTILNEYIHDVSQLITNSLQVELGSSLLVSLLSEFSSSSGSSAIGMPLEFHVKCKKALEENGGLLLIFTLVVQSLDKYISEPSQLDTECISSLLSLSLQILSWDFRQSYLYRFHLITSMNNVPLRPPPSFRTVLFNPGLLQLYVKVFKQCSGHSDFVRTSSLCLSQLASLCGPIFSSSDDSLAYLTNFLQIFTPVIMHSECFSDEAVYGVASIFRQLVTTFARSLYTLINEDLLETFAKTITDYCQLCCHRVIVLESSQEDVSVPEESLSFLLEVVVRLLEGPVDKLTGSLKGSMIKIITVYLQSKLNVPQGLKKYQTGSTLDLNLDDDDRNSYADELAYVGTISRCIPESALPLLLNMFLRCFSQLLGLCHSLLTNQNSSATKLYELESLYEDIHWLMLITTFTLTDVVESESSTIPEQLIDYSFTHMNTCSYTSEELVLATDYTSNSKLLTLNPLISLIICLCQWSVIEKQLVEKGLKDVVSPQVCESATWSMCTIFGTYLISSVKYDKMSPLLAQLLVDDNENSRWLLSFVLDKIWYNLSVWHSEEKLSLCSVQALNKLVLANRTLAGHFCSMDSLWLMMRSFANGQHPFINVSSSLQRDTIAALLSCACGGKSEKYVNELLKPLHYRFEALLTNEGSSCDKQQLLALIESWDGVAVATHNSIISIVFHFILPVLWSCVRLLETLHNFQDICHAILTLFSHVAETFTIFLDDADVNKMYEVCLQLITVYAKCHTGKFMSGLPADDEQYDDLTVFIQILIHLTTKDYIDFSSTDSSVAALSPIDVLLTGLSVVLPIINEDILKFPELCKKFYELLHYIFEIFPESFCALPGDLFQHTIKLIDMGCSRYGSDITLLCIECIEAISRCSPGRDTAIFAQFNEYFLKELFSRLLNHSFEADLLATFAGAIYQLMCSLHECNVNLETVLLAHGISGDSMKTLLDTTRPLLTGSRAHKKQFKSHFMDLLPNLRTH